MRIKFFLYFFTYPTSNLISSNPASDPISRKEKLKTNQLSSLNLKKLKHIKALTLKKLVFFEMCFTQKIYLNDLIHLFKGYINL